MSEKNGKYHSFVACSFCGGYKDYNYGHRKSEVHQKNMTKKLKVISFHLSNKCSKSTNQIKVHDFEWPNKDDKRFCHFCHDNYLEHYPSDDLIVENLGAMFHHHNSQHTQAVKLVLKENERKETERKYIICDEALKCFLEKVGEAKQKYLKKMDILNNMVLKQIKEVEHTRKQFVYDLEVATSAVNTVSECYKTTEKLPNLPKVLPTKEKIKIPPWLADEPTNCSTDEASASFNVKKEYPNTTTSNVKMEPSMDTLLKHICKQQKKGLPAKRLKANIKNFASKSAKWRPVFHGVWNKSRHRKRNLSKPLQTKKKYKQSNTVILD